MAKRARRYWLMKSEPATYGYDDLVRDGRTAWDGVRNYQARNLLRDEVAVGDRVLFYHSNADPPGVAGVAEVVAGAYPDPTQFDARSRYHDPKAARDAPRWFVVDLAPLERLPRFVPLEALREEPRLAEMVVLRRGSRLSVQPVTPEEYRVVLELGGSRRRS